MSEKKYMTIAFPSGGIVPAAHLKAKTETDKHVDPHDPVEVLYDYGQSLIADRFAYEHDGKAKAPAKPASAVDTKGEAKRIVDEAKAEAAKIKSDAEDKAKAEAAKIKSDAEDKAKRIVDRATLAADVTTATALVDIAPDDAKKAEAQKVLDGAKQAPADFDKPADDDK